MANVTGKASASFSVTAKAKISTRSYFSTHHLRAAKYATKDVEALENILIPNAPIFSGRQQSYVFTAIVESVAFLEAAINEVYQDAHDGHLSYIEPLGPVCIGSLSTRWIESGGGTQARLLEKYEDALAIAGKSPLDRGAKTYQDAKFLIELRNYIIHYKPQSLSVDSKHKLEKSLRGRFQLNPLRNESKEGWFPALAFGSGCAKWACESADMLVGEFSSRMGIELNYKRVSMSDIASILAGADPLD